MPTVPSCILKSAINLLLDSHITTIHNSLLAPLETESSTCYKCSGVISNHCSMKWKRSHNKALRLNNAKTGNKIERFSNRNE